MQKIWNDIESLCKPAHDNFTAAISSVDSIQNGLLKDILSRNINAQYLRSNGINAESSYEGFSSHLPIVSYDDIAADIQFIAEVNENRLTSEDVVLFEMTGGSSGGSKLIPYTSQSLRSFQDALYAWIYDILQHRPNIKKGRAYFAISPVNRSETVARSGIPIGTSDDSQYLGNDLASKLAKVLVIPGAAATLEEWKFSTCKTLLEADDLTLISVWSPTFLGELLKYIQYNSDRLLESINRSSPARAKQLAPIINGQPNYEAIWPRLDTISCWKDASSRGLAEQLQAHFPNGFMQGKGLLSTEGVVSFPLHGSAWPVLAITTNFYEFLGDDGEIYLANNLMTGKKYQVIITNYSGLYRYNTMDKVLVHGYEQQTPLLEFIGRSGICSDLCGEKLTEAFLLHAFMQVDATLVGNAVLQPCSAQPHYNLVIDRAYYLSKPNEYLVDKVEQALCLNPQYDYARKLGQLAEIELIIREDLMTSIIGGELQKGICFGHIKPRVLIGNHV